METLRPRPLLIEIEPTNFCNTQCVHCPHDTISRPVGKMDWETYTTLIDRALAITDDLYIDFAGMGEPLLNPLIYPFVEYAQGKAKTILTSNASALTAQNMGKLIASGLRLLTISFNGHDKALYELMMGGLNFERAQNNLEAAIHLIQGTSTEIQINLSVTRQTEDHLEEIRKYFLDRGIQNIIFSKCHNRGGFLKGDLICRTPLPPSHQSRCDIFSNTLFIAWNGDALSCCHDLAGENRLGNLKTDPIEAILSKKDEILRQGTFFEICKHCNDFYRFADDQKTTGISISQSVYDLYTGHLSARDSIFSDTAISDWLLATYFQEGKLHKHLMAINNSHEDEIAALRLDNQKLDLDNQKLDLDNQKLDLDNQKLDLDNQKLDLDNQKLGLDNQKLRNQLNEINQHRLWRIFQSIQKTRLFLVPKGSRREIIFKKIWGSKTNT